MQALYTSQLSLLDHTVAAASYLAVDLEMTGLSVKTEHILSIGWVPIQEREILLHQARHWLVRSSHPVGDSAIIHGIRDTDLDAAHPMEWVLQQFLQAARDRILIFHYARLDLAFLNKATHGILNVPCRPFYVDTMHLEHKRLLHCGAAIDYGTLQLASCRRRYGLPNYRNHSALVDALSTAELFLAISAGYKGKVHSLLT